MEGREGKKEGEDGEEEKEGEEREKGETIGNNGSKVSPDELYNATGPRMSIFTNFCHLRF